MSDGSNTPLSNYDSRLSDARNTASKALLALMREKASSPAVNDMAAALDNLNKAWDELTDCLVRQRSERNHQILALMDQLAEAKKNK